MKADRNVLRRLITFYEAGRSVDLSSVLKHELLPVPVPLAEMNGTLRTGNMSELANVVTEDIYCPETIQLHATSSFLIIDGQALVVKTVLKAGSEYHRIDVVFDRYRDETNKGTTRTRRSKTARPIRRLVEGRDVPLPKNWSNFLSLADNKADLSHFLSEELCSQASVDKDIVVADGFRDELEVKSSTGATDLGPLKSTHEETAVHTHWCSFQQPTKWICIIVASISRIDWVRHHLLHRESHQAIIMEDLQRAPWLAEELRHW